MYESYRCERCGKGLVESGEGPHEEGLCHDECGGPFEQPSPLPSSPSEDDRPSSKHSTFGETATMKMSGQDIVATDGTLKKPPEHGDMTSGGVEFAGVSGATIEGEITIEGEAAVAADEELLEAIEKDHREDVRLDRRG